ncbi:excisionase family DNA binding protein [Friedmanniella endophytica]|uniref:Excisionase family DNA binding protein n=1 Tax=Microlunatus kandeliicorticis TaxID=1759536 RepID=A0A7W3ITE8_9ACTN|nr:helix-turn-helix domain-containing protein [Microlunatus kandeliicorticis]MBA8794932.1 excisionase family DNA binding protein [Microlunatus kandeliicorticis]
MVAQPNAPTWLKMQPASDYTSLSPRTLRRYIADGVLVAYRIGPKELRFKRSDLDALFERVNG